MQRTDTTNWNIVDEGYTSEHASGSERIDEMLNSSGQVNPHWKPFIHALNTLGLEGLVTLPQRGS